MPSGRWAGSLSQSLGAAVFALGISRPILAIGEAANEVAKGNFKVQIRNVRSKDEIGELAKRINNMIVQINERFELAKFVSHGTMSAIQRSDAAGVALGGSRCEVAILFADIRGYTAFAESRDPETVVEVLNFHLARQAELVARHNGDIDKFVGDQIMAVFQGPDMAPDALTCAVEMQKQMAELSAASPDRDLDHGHRHRYGRSGDGRDRRKRPHGLHRARRSRQCCSTPMRCRQTAADARNRGCCRRCPVQLVAALDACT